MMIVDTNVQTKLDQWIISIGNKLSLVFLLCTTVIIFEIVSRYIFDSPTKWVHETTVLLGALLFLYGGPYVLAKKKHIRITFVHDILPSKLKYYLNILINIFCILYSLLMLFSAFLIAKDAVFTPWGTFHLETSGSIWNPPIPGIIKIFLFIIVIVMFMQYILHLITSIKSRKNV